MDASEERTPRTGRHTPHWRSGGRGKRKKTRAQPKPNKKGGRRPRDPRPGQAAAGTPKPRHDPPLQPEKKIKKSKGEEGGRPHPRQPPHAPTPQAAPPEAGRKQTRRTQEATRPNIQARKKRSAGKTRTHTHTPQTPARKGGMRPKPLSRHTHPRPQPGVARFPLNPTPNTRTTKPIQKWRGKDETRVQAHAP